MRVGVRVGVRVPEPAFVGGAGALTPLVGVAREEGLDHLAVGDHVTFRDGTGYDGLVRATALLAMTPDLDVHVNVYLLALRHPVPVARQLSSLTQLTPGRLVLGVGVGGDDPHEVAACGVDPRTRGRRTDEALDLVRRLLAGERVDFRGEFFDLEGVSILPVPDPPVPVVVGGRSTAALRRVGRLGDGWLGLWVSPERFATATAAAADEAERAGRTVGAWRHGLAVWCGFAATRAAARALVAPRMEGLYHHPFERFERWTPFGTPQDVAEALAPYVDAGASSLTLIPCAETDEQAIRGVGEVARALATR